MSRLKIAIALLTGFCASSVVSNAGEDSYRTDYRITLSGIPIASATFVTQLASSRYKIRGTFVSAGVADLITDISAETNVSGRLRNNQMEASHYSLVYRNGKKVRTYDVRLDGGNVTQSEIKPPPKKRPKNWIPVTASDLKAVLDPLSSLIIPDGEKICQRTLAIFDGESRMDLVLSHRGTKEFSSGGKTSKATVCSVRYVPKSGFRKGRDDVEYLSNVSGMEIWFAKTNDLPLYAPVYARIPTRYGPVYITAVKFSG
ncbi:DUF3108 domain-containing protein [Agrobacterium sp. ES01]|uniref:DUF3108 domain-containing protein n=1 Tax=Agrobacterium sp. ES01 TaxID=3420714 RepID=UPI003D0B3B2E